MGVGGRQVSWEGRVQGGLGNGLGQGSKPVFSAL